MKKYLFSAALVMLFLITGCALLNSSGKIKVISDPGENETTEYLVKNWNDFLIWYTGEPYGFYAVMFDPITDDRNLVAERWDKVGDKEKLVELIESLATRWPRSADLYRILGPDNQLYGYMFTKRRDVHIRAINENTLWVDDFPPPNYGP